MIIDLLNVVFFAEFLLNASFLCVSAIEEGDKGGGGGGSRSRFTENKTVLSQFKKNKDVMKITVHGELNISFSFHGK